MSDDVPMAVRFSLDEEEREQFATLRSMGCVINPCGSRWTNNPFRADSDQEYLVEWCSPRRGDVWGYLASHWWVCSSDSYDLEVKRGFTSWRRGNLNIILTQDGEFARRHRAGTGVLKHLNLPSKEDRIMVFQAVLYGNIHGAE